MPLSLRLFVIVTCCPILLFAKDADNYAVKNIPTDLLKNANAVVRSYTTEIEVEGWNRVRIKEHYAITILNEKGNKYARFSREHSDLITIRDLSGCIYDADGEEVKKVKYSDFADIPISMVTSEFSDERYKVYNASYRLYPYTVAYETETTQDYTFDLPDWSPQINDDCALQTGSLTVTVPDSAGLKFKEFNFNISPEVTTGKLNKTYKWSINNVAAKKTEPMSFTGSFCTPSIMLATNSFMFNNYKGSNSSWKDFGLFIYRINEGRDTLPNDVVTKIKQLVANAHTDQEKVSILYKYLQQTMRYVSIQYGIGGWQTLDARFLAKNQYGDCKALSNYMMAMLEAVGIRSYPVNIEGGDNNPHVMNTDFVCQQFNHVILCVPFTKDTMWLECTNDQLPANYLGNFTQNRDALMITDKGGVIVHTPTYDTSVNLVTRHAIINYNEDGTLKIDLASRYTGEEAAGLYNVLKSSNDHDKDAFLHSKFDLASYSINDYKYSREDNARYMPMVENATLTATGLYTKTGNRCFVNLDVAPIEIDIEDEDGDRKAPFHIPNSYAAIDTFEIAFPDKCDVEYISSPVSVRYPFGSYSYTITKSDDKVIAICRFTLNSGTYKPEEYKDYAKFTNLINSRAHKKVVFIKRV